MGLFDTIKKMFGFGLGKLELLVEPVLDETTGLVNGKLILTASSDFEITDLTVELEEKYTTGTGDDKKEDLLSLGELKLKGFTVTKGERKEIDFSLPFSFIKSSTQALADQGGVLGGIGKFGSFLDQEKSEYHLSANASVKGSLGISSDKIKMKPKK